jgi:hypothetical protein
MALANHALPYGVRDIKLTPITANVAGAITYGTFVDLPASRTLSWSHSEDFEQLRGDDTVVAERGNGLLIEWELEGGGISLDAKAVLDGSVNTTSGVSPNAKKTNALTGTTAKPYFRIDGKAINDNGGDTHVTIYRAKATGGVEGEFAEGSFTLTSASGTAYPNADNELKDIVHNETATDIIQPV